MARHQRSPRRARRGLGFTLGRGWTLVWSGGTSGAPRADNGMTARLPAALENGKPMVRRIRHEFHFGTRAPGKGSGDAELSCRLDRHRRPRSRCATARATRAPRSRPAPGIRRCQDDPSLAAGTLFAPYKFTTSGTRRPGPGDRRPFARCAIWSLSCATSAPTARAPRTRSERPASPVRWLSAYRRAAGSCGIFSTRHE